RVLGGLHARDQAPRLLEMLASDPDLGVRVSAAYGLRDLADPKMATPLANALRGTSDPQLQESILAALSAIGDPSTLSVIQQYANSPHELVRGSALNIIGRLGILRPFAGDSAATSVSAAMAWSTEHQFL